MRRTSLELPLEHLAIGVSTNLFLFHLRVRLRIARTLPPLAWLVLLWPLDLVPPLRWMGEGGD